MSRLKILSVVGIPLVCLLACSSSPPEVRAGDWRSSTEFGSFTFSITSDGAAIEDVQYSFRCGENFFDNSNFRMGEPYPLQGRELEFGVYLAGQVPMAVWHGEFSRDGQALTGRLEILAGACGADFEITR